MGTLALIGLGGNLGDRKAILDGAVAALSRTPGVDLRQVSAYHETAPVGGPPDQGAFLNAAARVETTLDPHALHRVLRDIEAQAGRVRRVRWGERTLDLDLLLFGEQIIEAAELVVPHPRMAVRRFVLAPAIEVAEHVLDPLTHRTMSQLLAHLDRRPSYVAIDAPPGAIRSGAFHRIVAVLGAIGLQQEIAEPPPDDPAGQCRYCNDFTARARQLAAPRWPANERWLVTDFCLSLERQRPPQSAEPPGTPEEYARSPGDGSLVDEALTPTFAVVLGDRPEPRRPQCVAPFPLLWVHSNDPEHIAAETLAACQASRA